MTTETRPPRVGHTKSRRGCAQCKKRHVKCNEEKPCSNCVRHGVACSLAGGPYVTRDDPRPKTSTPTLSTTQASPQETLQNEAAAAALRTVPTSGGGASMASSSDSPYAVLTGLVDRSLPGDDQDRQWKLDLELMHHYMTHTRYILVEHPGLETIFKIWQDYIPQLAFANDYVMHALLGFTALHKAHHEPGKAATLRTTAVDHLDKALVLHRQNNIAPTADNADARYLFTWVVALFGFAIPMDVPPIDAIVELFLLVRGIVSEDYSALMQGPLAPLLTNEFNDVISFPDERYVLPEGMDPSVGHLDYMLGIEAMLPDDRRVCILTLAELRLVYKNVLKAYRPSNVNAIITFPKHEAASFSDLVKRRVPQALVILAYHCVPLDVLDGRWWVHGWSKRLLKDVVERLPERWQQWVEWPVQCVLKMEHPPSTRDRDQLLL